jgi:hypothetical protein
MIQWGMLKDTRWPIVPAPERVQKSWCGIEKTRKGRSRQGFAIQPLPSRLRICKPSRAFCGKNHRESRKKRSVRVVRFGPCREARGTWLNFGANPGKYDKWMTCIIHDHFVQFRQSPGKSPWRTKWCQDGAVARGNPRFLPGQLAAQRSTRGIATSGMCTMTSSSAPSGPSVASSPGRRSGPTAAGLSAVAWRAASDPSVLIADFGEAALEPAANIGDPK